MKKILLLFLLLNSCDVVFAQKILIQPKKPTLTVWDSISSTYNNTGSTYTANVYFKGLFSDIIIDSLVSPDTNVVALPPNVELIDFTNRLFNQELLNPNFENASTDSSTCDNWVGTADQYLFYDDKVFCVNVTGNLVSDPMPSISIGDTIKVYLYLEPTSTSGGSILYCDMNGAPNQNTGNVYVGNAGWYSFTFNNIVDNQVRFYGGGYDGYIHNVFVIKKGKSFNWTNNGNTHYEITSDSTMLIVQDSVNANSKITLPIENIQKNQFYDLSVDAKESLTNIISNHNSTFENNSVNDWGLSGKVTQSIVQGYNSNYALAARAVDGSSDRTELTISGLTIGEEYKYKVFAKASGASSTIQAWGIGTITTKPITGEWAEYSETFTAIAASGVVRFYAAVSGSAGDTIFIDNFRLYDNNNYELSGLNKLFAEYYYIDNEQEISVKTDSSNVISSNFQTLTIEFSSLSNDSNYISFYSKNNANIVVDNVSILKDYYHFKIEHADTAIKNIKVKSTSLGSNSINLSVYHTVRNNPRVLPVVFFIESLSSLIVDTVDFDTITVATLDYSWIKNISSNTLNISSYSGLDAPFYSTAGREVTTLGPGDSTQLEIYFNPLSTNGAFLDTLLIAHDGNGGSVGLIVQGVANLPSSNLLLAGTNLTASTGSGAIDLAWTDPNTPDTTEFLRYDFNLQSDTTAWPPRHNEPKERVITGGKMKLFDDNLGTSWPSAVHTMTVNSSDTYKIKGLAEVGTANSVWFVIINNATGEYYANMSSTVDTLFEYLLVNPTAGTIDIYLQASTDNTEYSFYEYFAVDKTESSYEGFEIYAQKFLGGTVDIPYYLLEYVTGSATTYSHSVNDGDQYSYKVRYKNNTDYSLFSNEDTLLYSAPSIYADYYVKATGTNTTFSTATSIGNEMDMDTFEAGWAANLSVNDLVHFSGDFEKEYLYGVTAVNSIAWDLSNLPDGVKLFSTDKAKITVFQELYGWDDTDHWVLDNTTYSDGTTFWTYDFSDFGYYDLEEAGCSRLWFDDKETPMWLSPDISAEGSTVGATGAAKDSTFGRPNANYRFTVNKYDMAAVREVHVWDSAGINPATKYNSIKHVGGFKQLIHFENTDNLIVDGITFEGSDFFTVTFKNCDNVTFSNNYITKFEYMAIRFNDCATVTMFGDSIYSGYADVSGTGHIYYEYFSAMNGLDIQNSTSNASIYNCSFMDITTMPFRVISSTGNTTNVYFHDNVIGTNITMDYARPYQIGESTAGAAYYPSNIHIYNNLMKNGTMRTKNIAQYTYTYFNTFVDWTNFKDSISHHFNSTGGWDKPSATGMGNSFQFGHTSGTALSAVANEHWWFNNTYLNFNATPISYESKYQRAIPLYWINNAFINMSRKHVKKGTGHPSFTNATGDIDFLISEQGNSPFVLKNNYIWNDQTDANYGSSIVYGQYNGSTFTTNYHSLSSFESAVTGSDTASNNIKETNVAKTISDIINTTTYEMQTTSAQDNGYMDSRILTILGPNFFDRWGNRVTNADGTLYNSQINRGSNNK